MANTIQFKRGGTAPGSLAAGEIAIDTTNQKLYYGNASAQVTEAGGSSAIEASFTADGAISAGDPVGIQASGKVKTIGTGYNSAAVDTGQDEQYRKIIYVPHVDRFLAARRDDDDGDDVHLSVVKVEDGAVTLGTELDIGGSMSNQSFDMCYDPDTERVLVVGNLASGFHVGVVTVTGGTTNTAAIGTTTAVDGSGTAVGVSIAYDTHHKKALMTYLRSSTHYSRVVNVTGGTTNTVSLGTAQKLSDDNISGTTSTVTIYDHVSNYFFHSYELSSGDDVRATMSRIGEASGTDDKIDESNSQITIAGNANYIGMAYDPDAGGALVVYLDKDDDHKIKGRFIYSRERNPETGLLQGDLLMTEPMTLTDAGADDNGRNSFITYNPVLKHYVLVYVNKFYTRAGADPSAFPPPDTGTLEYIFIKSDGFSPIKTSRFGQRCISTISGSPAFTEQSDGFVACSSKNGDTLISWLDVESETGKFLAVSPEDSNHYKYIGIAQSSVSDGASVTVSLQGQAVTNQEGKVMSFGKRKKIGTANDDYHGSYGNIVYDPDADRYIFAYIDAGNSNYGTAVVIQHSNGTITHGTPVVYESASTSATTPCTTYDTNVDRVVITYQDTGNSNYLTYVVGTVTAGTNAISFGTPGLVGGGDYWTFNSLEFDPDTNRVIAAGNSSTNSDVRAYVGTVTGGTTNTISWGSTNEIDGANGGMVNLAYDTNVDRIVVAYKDGNNSNYGTCRVGTVTGGTTNSISWGSATVFNSEITAMSKSNEALAFDDNSNKVLIVYLTNTNAINASGEQERGAAIVGTVTGGTTNSISFGTEKTFDGAGRAKLRSEDLAIKFDSNSNKFIGKYVTSREPFGIIFFAAEISGTNVILQDGPIYVNLAPSDNPYTVIGINPTTGQAIFTFREAARDANAGDSVISCNSAILNTMPGQKYCLLPSGIAVSGEGGHQQNEVIRYGTGYTTSGGMIIG